MKAVDRAASLSKGDAVRWKRLELDAFEAHPAVQRALDPSGKHGRQKTWRDRAGIALAIAAFVVLIAPVSGVALLFSGRFSAADVDYAWAVPVAGISFLVGCLLAVPTAVRAVIRWADGQVGFGLFALVVGAVAWGRAAFGQPEDDVAARALWIIPIALFTLSGAALLAVGLFGKRDPKKTPRKQASGNKAQGRRANVDKSLEELSEQERQAVEQDLRTAISDLAHRGVIRPQDADWAAGADLGGLSRRMSEPRR